MPTIKTLITYLLFLLFTVYAHAKTTYTISELPAPIKQKIEPQLKEFFKEDLEQVKFEALAGGMSGTPVYKATLKDNIYVVRVYGDNELAAYETTLLTRIAGNHQFGSKVYYPLNNKPTRILISGFANGKAPNPSEYPQYKNNLAKSLRELHSITTQALPMGANLFVRSRASLSKVGQLGPFLEGLSIINKIENALTRSPFRFGITHQDLNTLNFLYDGKKFTYIDWADGGFGDQMGDVANLTLEFGLDDKQATEFLHLYLDKEPAAKEMAQFNLWRKAAEFRLMAWAYEMIHKAGGTYEPTKPKWTIPELVKNVRSGKFDPKTAQDFNDIFAVANAQWKSNLDQVDIWIKNI